MSKERFIKLLEEFCALTKIDKPGFVLQDGIVTVNGVTFSLRHEEEADADLLFLYTDFGKLPAKQELEVCKALMEANLFLFATKQQFSFAISPNTKNATLACRISLKDLTSERLRTLLIDLSAKARAWRINHFFDLKPKSPQSGKSALHALYVKAGA